MKFWLTTLGLIFAIFDPIEDHSSGSHPLDVIEPIEDDHGRGRGHGRGGEHEASNNTQKSEPTSSSTLSPQLLDYHCLNRILSALLERL